MSIKSRDFIVFFTPFVICEGIMGALLVAGFTTFPQNSVLMPLVALPAFGVGLSLADWVDRRWPR